MPTATEPLPAIREAVRLLAATASLPPTGGGRVAVRQGDGIATAALEDLGPLGSGTVSIIPADTSEAAGSGDLLVATLRSRADQGAALLAAPTYLTAWSLARRPLPVRYSPLLRFTADDHIPVVFSADTAAVVAAFTATPGLRALLIPGHGVLVLGRDLATAARSLVSLEEAAHLAWEAHAIGGAQPFPTDAGERVARGIAGDAA